MLGSSHRIETGEKTEPFEWSDADKLNEILEVSEFSEVKQETEPRIETQEMGIEAPQAVEEVEQHPNVLTQLETQDLSPLEAELYRPLEPIKPTTEPIEEKTEARAY